MSIAQRFHEKTRAYVKVLQSFVDRYWYPPFIGLLAALDNLIVVIPNDGILISSTMLIPKRWLILAVNVAVGSTLGAIALSLLVEYQGLPLILKIYPGLVETQSWNWTLEFFEKHGLLLIFIVAVTPFVQQPAVILASLANTPLVKLAMVIFVGRLIKFLIMAYVASHAPRLLKKMWGIRDELNDTGVKLE